MCGHIRISTNQVCFSDAVSWDGIHQLPSYRGNIHNTPLQSLHFF